MTLETIKSLSTNLPEGLATKIDKATNVLLPNYHKHLENIATINPQNAEIICDYIAALKHEVNPSDHYRKDIINLLTILAKSIQIF